MKCSLNSVYSQLPLFEAIESELITRPIHYLGSKLRLVDSIIKVIDELDPSMGPVCDLFSGSGTVSGFLSITRDVTAIDIQEYSRVICSALLKPACLLFAEE